MTEKEMYGALKKMVRFGTVTSVNLDRRTARVWFGDMGIPSRDLRVSRNESTVRVQTGFGPGAHTHDVIVIPWMPDVGQMVVCLYAANSKGSGVIIGGL